MADVYSESRANRARYLRRQSLRSTTSGLTPGPERFARHDNALPARTVSLRHRGCRLDRIVGCPRSTRMIVDQLTGNGAERNDRRRRVLALQSRHQLFPQVFRYVDEYVRRKVNFNACDPCELGLEKYVQRIVERLREGIVPDDSEGEPPLMPILNRYKPTGTTSEVDFKTTRPCHTTMKSHIDQVVLDNLSWEASAAFRLESCEAVEFYARNDHLGLTIPYEYMGIDHAYEPDFLVRLSTGAVVLLEIKGFEDDQTKAKHAAAKRWIAAVNNWGQLGTWVFHVCHNPQLLGKEMEYLARVQISDPEDLRLATGRSCDGRR